MAKKKSAPESLARLSRRERQIMDIVYALGSATSKEVLSALAGPAQLFGGACFDENPGG